MDEQGPGTSCFADVTNECGLVMKGGVTSGIVYPPAVIELAKQYRFHYIGGTSAGAIAAAATAAAEYGREQGGIEELQRISDQLANERGFVRNLFRPSKETRPLMEILLALVDKTNKGANGGVVRWLLLSFPAALLQHDRGPFIQGVALGVLAALVLSLAAALITAIVAALLSGSVDAWLREFTSLLPSPLGAAPVARLGAAPTLLLVIVFLLLVLLFGWIGCAATGIARLHQLLTKSVPENFYGMVKGHESGPSGGPGLPLTDWLHESIQRLAGRTASESPLTFGDLEQLKPIELEDGRKLREDGIKLRMVSTNLSHEQPYILPFSSNSFLFREAEWQELFPEHVISRMKMCAFQSATYTPPDGYFFLPEGKNLPIVVAARMSLSFPILISAIPLYTVNLAAFETQAEGQRIRLDAQRHLQLNWFSDGGISSNFPIHIFDDWLPTIPAFGINLTALPPHAVRDDSVDTTHISVLSESGIDPNLVAGVRASVARDIYLPRASDPPVTEWKPIEKLQSFMTGIWTTAQNYRDNTQSMLPSYRNRIIQVRLAANEGGLNLEMPPDVISVIAGKGRRAGVALRDEFVMEHNKWLRFLVLMAQVEERGKQVVSDYKDGNYRRLLTRHAVAPNAAPLPYDRDADWCKEAVRRAEGLLKHLSDWTEFGIGWRDCPEAWGGRAHFARDDNPAPRPALRVTPEL